MRNSKKRGQITTAVNDADDFHRMHVLVVGIGDRFVEDEIGDFHQYTGRAENFRVADTKAGMLRQQARLVTELLKIPLGLFGCSFPMSR